MESSISSSPVCRRCPPQYFRSPAGDAQPPWNTARCNRLLRPLSSKIACLRKSHQYELQCGRENAGLEQVLHGKQNQTDTYSPPNAGALSGENPALQSSKTSKTDDHEWVPSPVPRKKIKRTYSSRDGGHLVRQTKCKKWPSLPDETTVQMPDSEGSFVDRQGQAFLRITGSKPPNVDRLSVSGLRAQYPKQSHTTKGSSQDTFCQHARYIQPGHWKLINGLYNGLDALLRATGTGRAGDEPGARSLFSTCLRKVPEYIAEEQLWSTVEDPESGVDVASFVYSHLEALGTSPTGGWKPLREIVRAHGVSMLEDAFKEGLLNPSLAHGLIVICLHHHAYDEAQQFVECIINLMKPLRKSQATPKQIFSRDVSVELSILKYFVTASGRFGFLYRQLTALFSSGITPVEWISSPSMVDCWNGVKWSITQEDGHARAAAVLLQTTMSMVYGGLRPPLDTRVHEIRLLGRGGSSDSVSQTSESITSLPPESPRSGDPKANGIGNPPSSVMSDILTVLCAIGILERFASKDLSSRRTLTLTLLQDLALTAYQAVATKRYKANPGQDIQSCAEQSCLPFIAAKLVEERACKSGETLASDRPVPVDVITQFGHSESLLGSGASFICAVAHCCERATSAEAFDYMLSIVHQLTHVSTSSHYGTATGNIYGQIAVAAAFEYSEESNHPRHLDWALDLEQSIAGTSVETTYRTPGKTLVRRSLKSKSGYRWEEGICEWVGRTPAALWPPTDLLDHQGTGSGDGKSDSDLMAASASPSKHGLLNLPQMSPWSSDEKPAKAPGHLTKNSHPTFHISIGKTTHVDKTPENADELKHVDDDGILPTRKADDSDTEDELSTPAASQEMPKTSRPQLREITNIGASMTRKRATTWKQNDKTRRRRPLCHSTKTTTQRLGAGPLKADESLEESEDELSVLAC